MIYGIGTDIVKIDRIRNATEKWGRRFLEKILTDNEISYCYSRKDPFPSLSVRFAAKEAVIKAIGSEIQVNMKEAEIESSEAGRPLLRVYGRLEAFFKEKDIRTSHLSLSHEKEFGIAIVVLET
jgi:holo-[acyl-carrier protein] synthase